MRKFLRPLLRGLARLLFRVDVQLRQADFSHPHLLIVANHESFLDGLLIGLFLPALPVHTPLSFVLLAEALAAAIGLAAGVLPARRAAMLDPVEALRTE